MQSRQNKDKEPSVYNTLRQTIDKNKFESTSSAAEEFSQFPLKLPISQYEMFYSETVF